MSEPFVSVILPTHNRAALLPRALASVLNQTFRDFELIVVDDGSTDGTETVVRSCADARVVYLRHDAASGDAHARNAGVARARGTWLAFQDSDDEWVPHMLATQVPAARAAGEDVALIGSALLRVAGEAVAPIFWPLRQPQAASGDVDRGRFLAGFCAYLQSALIRRSAFADAGGFDTSLRARSDFDLCVRLVERHRAIASRDLLAISYESCDGISGRADLRRHDIRRLLDKHGAMLRRSRRAHARYLYDLGRAELACGERLGALRVAGRALALDPTRPRHWALLALCPFGARGLHAAAAARRHFGRTP